MQSSSRRASLGVEGEDRNGRFGGLRQSVRIRVRVLLQGWHEYEGWGGKIRGLSAGKLGFKG